MTSYISTTGTAQKVAQSLLEGSVWFSDNLLFLFKNFIWHCSC